MVEGYKRGIWFIGKESPSLLCRQPPLGKGAFERFASKPYASQYGYIERCRKEVIMWFMEQLMKKAKSIIHI